MMNVGGKMLDECNFKIKSTKIPISSGADPEIICTLTKKKCSGENKCILYQIYEELYL